MHLDDEVARSLDRIGVAEGFLARSRPGSGLRLLDASHHVMAEFSRDHQPSQHGFPQANMFHQPDLEELLFARVERHPLIDFRRGAEVTGLDGTQGPVTADRRSGYTPASPASRRRSPAGSCWAATAPTARSASWPGSPWTTWASPNAGSWSISASATGLDTWDGVEQICDPARAATFMQVTGDRYRWEFRLRDGEDEAGLITPAALGALLRPWTGRGDLDGLQIIRSATYTFRAQMASRFRTGRVFLLGDAAHLTPPFIGQGLAGGLRDADNLAWKLAHVLTGRAGEDLLDTLRQRTPPARHSPGEKGRPGRLGDDRRAGPRRRRPPDRPGRRGPQRPHLPGHGLHGHPAAQGRRPAAIPAALPPVRHSPRAAGRRPDPQPAGVRRRRHAGPAGRHPGRTPRRADRTTPRRRTGRFLPSARPGPGADQRTRDRTPRPGPGQDAGWIDVRLADDAAPAGLRALAADPALTVLVRPDRVVAAVGTRCRRPRLPWSIPAAAGPERPATAPPAAHPESASPVTTTP